MDNSNSNSLSNALLQSSEKTIPSASFDSTGESSGFFDTIQNINLTTWLLIIFVLAFLGFNVFVYLAKGTEDISNFFAPILKTIFGTTLSVTGQTVDVAAEGGKSVVTGTANVINAGLSTVQDITPNNAQSSIKTQSVQDTVPTQNKSDNTSLNKALNATGKSQNSDSNQDYQGVESSSSVHTSSAKSGKAGWCYIGEDRGYRTCAEVGVNDMCMSGDIFPSNEICINPNLRP
jgi:hypothetical protein